eukprot:9464033-Alexandrium_andersonii.AAC.1
MRISACTAVATSLSQPVGHELLVQRELADRAQLRGAGRWWHADDSKHVQTRAPLTIASWSSTSKVLDSLESASNGGQHCSLATSMKQQQQQKRECTRAIA